MGCWPSRQRRQPENLNTMENQKYNEILERLNAYMEMRNELDLVKEILVARGKDPPDIWPRFNDDIYVEMARCRGSAAPTPPQSSGAP